MPPRSRNDFVVLVVWRTWDNWQHHGIGRCSSFQGVAVMRQALALLWIGSCIDQNVLRFAEIKVTF